jgi:hypothetical protein
VWTVETHLLAGIHDRLAQANWQRGGGKGPRPKSIPRPGTRNERKYGKVPAGRTPADVKAMLARAAGRPVPSGK